jgi:hypothetical protein
MPPLGFEMTHMASFLALRPFPDRLASFGLGYGDASIAMKGTRERRRGDLENQCHEAVCFFFFTTPLYVTSVCCDCAQMRRKAKDFIIQIANMARSPVLELGKNFQPLV